MTTSIYWDMVPTAQGSCVIMATATGICWAGTPGTPVEEGYDWCRRVFGSVTFHRGASSILAKACQELADYAAGKPVTFTVPFEMHGTPFQKSVWQEMLRIPYGQTKTYGQVAVAVGKPKSARAVGGACNANPIAVLVPCHRIVGSSGALTGYGGGLPTKEWLLALERNGISRT